MIKKIITVIVLFILVHSALLRLGVTVRLYEADGIAGDFVLNAFPSSYLTRDIQSSYKYLSAGNLDEEINNFRMYMVSWEFGLVALFLLLGMLIYYRNNNKFFILFGSGVLINVILIYTGVSPVFH